MKKRKIFALLLTMVLLAALSITGAFTTRAEAAEIVDSGTCGDNLTWTLNDDYVLTISGSGEMAKLGGWFTSNPWGSYKNRITSVVIKYGASNVGAYAFSDCTALTSVTIPSSVSSIDYCAFYGCTALKEIYIPASVSSIGSNAFQNCSSLSSVTLNKGLTTIYSEAFRNCDSLKSISIPQSVTTIGSSALRDCDNLKTVSILNSCASIGGYCFADCGNLSNLTLGNSITSIGEYAFYGCTRLKSVDVPDSASEIGQNAFSDCTSLANVTLGDGLTSIGQQAFRGCSKLTSMVIPEGVTSISYNLFGGCTGLTSVTLGSKVTTIGNEAFYNCYNLSKINIPQTVTSIGQYAFRGCASLTSMSIPDNVTSLGYRAFYYCSGMTSVKTGLRANIGANAFENCTNLTSVTIGEKVTTIGEYAFYGCSSLEKIRIPNSVVNINNHAFMNCTSMTSAVIGNGATGIGSYAFESCSNLSSLTVGNSVTHIDEGAFYKCSNLSSVFVPNSVTSIGAKAFYYCTSLSGVTIGNSVLTIGESAFNYCTSLTDVFYTGTRDDWYSISVGYYNYWLNNATIHYNSVPLTISKQPKSQSVKADTTVSFTVTASGNGLKYQWQYRTSSTGSWKNSSADSATTRNFSVKATTARNGYQYRCKITDSEGKAVYSDIVTLNVTGVTITTQPKTQNVKADATAKFTVKATGSGLKYQWQYRTSSSGSWKNSGASSATSKTFSVKGTTARNGYQYRCKVTDSAGNTVYSKSATLYVLGITTQPKTTTVANNATAKFTVKATGNGLKYQWQYRTSSSGSWKNSGATSATSKTFSVKGTSDRNGYQYRCKITDSAGNTIYSSTVTLKVSAASITTQPKSVTVADGKTAKFTVKTSGSGLKFQWQYRTSASGSWKNSGASSATSKTFSVKGTYERDGYQYRCRITDKNGNVIYTNTVTLTVN